MVERDQPVAVSDIPEREDDPRDDRRPDELALEPRDRRRAGIAAGHDRPVFLLAAHAPGKNREQHHPPDDEIDRDRSWQRHQSVSLCYAPLQQTSAAMPARRLPDGIRLPASSRLFDLDQRAAKILRVQEQYRLALGADLPLPL